MAVGQATVPSSWTRVIDYLFGRNALIGVASLMLLLISGYATWAGMHDFIVGVSPVEGLGRQGPGGINVSHDLLVIIIVTALTFLMWLALRETFGAGRRLSERLITFPLYLFLAVWSVGFGYGFWWSLIAGQEATRSSIAGLQEDARDAAAAIAARLDAVRVQIDSVVSWSDSQMSREETSGSSCGIQSGAGRGKLYTARRSVRDSVTSLRDSIDGAWLAPVKRDLEQLQQGVTAPRGATVAERQRLFEMRAAAIRGKARSIAARSNELGKSTAAEMRTLAAAVSVKPGRPGFTCFDPTLAQRLRLAADQADQPALLKLRQAAFNEGPAGTANAIKSLWQNIGTYVVSLGQYVVSAGAAGQTTTEAGNPITGRDLIALLASIGIDLGIFVMALLDPPATQPIRRDGLREAQSNLRQVTESTKAQIRGAIHTAIARADASLQWVHGHFIHHAGRSYFVIPNLYRADRSEAGKAEEQKALAMNQLAGVFSDVKLIEALSPRELKRAAEEEKRDSLTDLTVIRAAHKNRAESAAGAGEARPTAIRNHGLLSKAQRALDIAGWTEFAQSDVEIFKVVDVEGLTPLLDVLTEVRQQSAASSGGQARAAEVAAAAAESRTNGSRSNEA